jgi:hypothetical protein
MPHQLVCLGVNFLPYSLLPGGYKTMSDPHAKSETDIQPTQREFTAAPAVDHPLNKDLDAVTLWSSEKSAPPSSDAGNAGSDWSTHGLFKTKTTKDADGTSATVMVDRNDKPYDVSVTAQDGSNTHLLFGPDGNPDKIYQSGPAKPDSFEFKTQDGTDYRFTDLTPVIDRQHPDGQVLPRMTITSSDGRGGSVETSKQDTEKGWQTDEVEHDYANHSRDYTYYNPPTGTPYIEKVSQNPDGGYNEGFYNINDGFTPINGMDSYRMIPDGQGGKNFTFMKSDGTVDYRESVDQFGATTRVDASGNPLPVKS